MQGLFCDPIKPGAIAADNSGCRPVTRNKARRDPPKRNMTDERERQIKTEALMTVAQAYADRGHWLQYDQLSMDRVACVSARRIATAPPEAASPGRYAFLDCSSFCWACYYQAFDYALESCLTWHMIDVCEPRVFYYELTHQESELELAVLKAKLRDLLQPGDIITYQYENGNGHAMLYVDEEKYINCSQKGVFNGYSYRDLRNDFTEGGGIYYEEVRWLFEEHPDHRVGRSNLFAADKKRFSVTRPLDVVGEPTADTMARMQAAKDLVCSIVTDAAPGRTAPEGAAAGYELVVYNKGSEEKRLEVVSGADTRSASVLPGASARFRFAFAGPAAGGRARVPDTTVNGLRIYSPQVCFGRILTEEETTALLTAVSGRSRAAETAAAAALRWYERLGARLPQPADKMLYRLFALHDSNAGDVLARFPQRPQSDCAAPGLYGGRGVVTPGASEGFGGKELFLSQAQLAPGDIVLAADDALCTQHYISFYTGENLVGSFGPGEPERAIGGEEMRSFIESLPGRFVFAVLRPSLAMRP